MYNSYPNNFDYSDDSSFSHSTQPLFAFDDPWSVGHYQMSVPDDTLPVQSVNGLDAFGEITDDTFFSDEFSDGITDDEIGSTPPHSSPISVPSYSPCCHSIGESKEIPLAVFPHVVTPIMQPRQLYFQYPQVQWQHQVLQPNLYLSALPPVTSIYCQSVPTVSDPTCTRTVPLSVAPRPTLVEDQQSSLDQNSIKLTSLDTSYFGTNITPYPKLQSIPVDISGNLTDAQYNKIFKKYHLHLQLDSHPTLTELDLEDIKLYGRMYFLKNVKTIVPKVGPWKFNAHISHRRSDERQYNIPGMAVTCKVKEWLTDEGLWRLYHYKRGKTVKGKK